MKHKLIKIFLTILGAVAVFWIIWMRFIIERLPKELPLNLTELGFYFVCYLCCLYGYITIRILKPKEIHPTIKKFIEAIFTPLKAFDTFLKHNRMVYPKYSERLLIAIKYIESLILSQLLRINIILTIIPRMFLISAFFIDIFYFHKLELMYNFIFLSTLPLMHRYFKYSLKFAKEHYLEILINKYTSVWLTDQRYATDPDWKFDPEVMVYHEKNVSIEKYLKIQTENYFNIDENKVIYIADAAFARKEIYTQYCKDKYGNEGVALTHEDYEEIQKLFFKIMPALIILNIFLEIYVAIEAIPKIRYSRAIIFSLYCVCWLYLVITCYSKIESFPIFLTITYWLIFDTEDNDPFSGTSIY